MPSNLSRTAPFPLNRLAFGIAFGIGSSLLATSMAQAAEREIEEVTVTATYLTRSLDDIAGTVSVISAQEIEQQLADDLNDITRFQPGISMDTASRGGNQGFVIRGIGGNRVLTVIDGIRSNDIYAAGPASYGKDAFEVDDLKAVEIIRGPASVLYGADAMGGAVILRSKDPRDYLADGQSSALSLRSSYNSVNDLTKLGGSFAFQSGDVGTVVQYTRRDFSESEINGSGRLNPQDGQSDSWLLKSVWTPSDVQELRLTLDYSNELVDTRLDSDLGSSVQRSIGEDETDRLRVSLVHVWNANLAFADTVETQFHWQRTDAQQYSEQTLTSYAFVNPRNPASFRGAAAERFSDFEFNQETANVGLLLTKSLATGSAEPAAPASMGHSMEFWRIDTDAEFALSKPGLAEAEEMADVLLARANALSTNPAREDVLILAHGPGDDAENERWLAFMDERAQLIRDTHAFRSVKVATLREDWEEKRVAAEQEVREFVADANATGGTAIVIPYRVHGFGPYGSVLEGLDYVADGRGLIPHAGVTRWIEAQIAILEEEL